MQNRIKIYGYLTLFLCALFSGCEEAERYEISGNDRTPPGVPVFVESEALPGGARVFFLPPPDIDVLYIEASYLNVSGKTIRFTASFAGGSVDVYGFDRAGEHTIELCAVDRAGNRSKSILCTVEALEPIGITLAKSVEVLSSFSSLLIKWKNESEHPLYVWIDISYTQNGVRREHTTVFNTYQSETRSIDSLNLVDGELVSVKVNVKDKFDNVVHAKDTAITLLVDEVLLKDGWSMPVAGTVMGDITQTYGMRMESVIDGIIDIDNENYFYSTQANPWNLIIDLGQAYEISRIVTHQRWTGLSNQGDLRGNLYRGGNIMMSILHRWDETSQAWDLLSRRTITSPVVKSDNDYTVLGKTGDMSFIFPEEPQFSKPTRFFRLEAINGNYISEITLYGRKVQ